MALHPPPAPGPSENRLAAYLEGLAQVAGHRDRWQPLKNYCHGLLLPGERQSVEPMAARLAPDNVRRMHQSMHHVVADAPWNDQAVHARKADYREFFMRCYPLHNLSHYQHPAQRLSAVHPAARCFAACGFFLPPLTAFSLQLPAAASAEATRHN
jgi:hypothetical protein